MDINTIISSGLLESYVLGNSSPEESLQVKELCNRHPEIMAEIEAIENALISYSSINSPEISSSFKQKLFAQLSNNSINNKAEAKIIPLQPEVKNNNSYKYLVAASLALLLGSSVFNYVQYDKLKKADTELSTAYNNEKDYQEQLKNQQIELKNRKDELAVLSDPQTKQVNLKSTDVKSTSMALIYWNSSNHNTYISLAQLPEPPEGKQYQLWAIVDGKPIDAGVFDMAFSDGPHLQKMKEISNAQAFAVTLENKGGSLSPTLTAMCVSGNV